MSGASMKYIVASGAAAEASIAARLEAFSASSALTVVVTVFVGPMEALLAQVERKRALLVGSAPTTLASHVG